MINNKCTAQQYNITCSVKKPTFCNKTPSAGEEE